MRGESAMARCVQCFEYAAASNGFFGRLYNDLFYRAMNRRECALAAARPGETVFHVGCGPFPMTTIRLARKGCRVIAIDSDDAAIRCAERTLASFVDGATAERITLRLADARNISYAGADIVVVALHVAPKSEVVRRILDTCASGTRLLYRNPRSALRCAYSTLLPFGAEGVHGGKRADGASERNRAGEEPVSCGRPPLSSRHFGTTRVPWGKSVVRLDAGEEGGAASCAACDLRRPCGLCDLSPSQCGIIANAPGIPALAALGVRPGKKCRVVARQPFGGPLVCSISGRQFAIERSIARTIELIPERG